MTQAFVMLALAMLCFVSAVGWAFDGQGFSALAFTAFGIGYIGLAGIFGGW